MMKHPFPNALAGLIVFLATAPVSAGTTNYTCEISEILMPGQGKEVADYTLQRVQKDKLIIDRETGRAFHPTLGNTSGGKIHIVDRGSSQNSFKALRVISGVGSYVDYYEVKEYTSGPVKPMLLVNSGAAYSGVCR